MTAWWMPPIHLSMARARTTVSAHPFAAKDKQMRQRNLPLAAGIEIGLSTARQPN